MSQNQWLILYIIFLTHCVLLRIQTGRRTKMSLYHRLFVLINRHLLWEMEMLQSIDMCILTLDTFRRLNCGQYLGGCVKGQVSQLYPKASGWGWAVGPLLMTWTISVRSGLYSCFASCWYLVSLHGIKRHRSGTTWCQC